MADKYPLSALLQVREQERDAAKSKLARAVGQVNAARASVSTVREQIDATQFKKSEAAARERDRLEETFDLSMVSRQADFERAVAAELRQLDEQLAAAKKRLSDALTNERRRREELTVAERELEAVEKHHEGWKSERAIVQKRRQSAAMDDIAIARWEKERE